MMIDLPDNTLDWIRTHCTALRLTAPPKAGEEEVDTDRRLREQTAFLLKMAHPTVGDIYLNLVELHLRGTPFLLALEHYVDRDEALQKARLHGFEAELAFTGWAYGFDVREGHPLLDGDEGCFICHQPITAGQYVIIMPGPDPAFHPYHSEPCLAEHLGIGKAP